MKKQSLTIKCPSCNNEECIDIHFDTLPFSAYDWFSQCSKCKVMIHIKMYIQAVMNETKHEDG